MLPTVTLTIFRVLRPVSTLLAASSFGFGRAMSATASVTNSTGSPLAFTFGNTIARSVLASWSSMYTP